jgi:hypothetical protein
MKRVKSLSMISKGKKKVIFSKSFFEKDNKVIENLTKEVKNNKVYIKGILKGKRINKTKKLSKKLENKIKSLY